MIRGLTGLLLWSWAESVGGHGAPPPAYGKQANHNAHPGAPAPHAPHQPHQPHQPHHGGFGKPEDLRDQEHIKSHLAGEIDTEEEWTEDKIKFFYFTMFDSSKDNRLDGLEIFHAIRHNDEEHTNSTQQAGKTPEVPLTEVEVEAQTDQILLDMDRDLDGFINWPEFVEYVDKMDLAKPQT